MKLGAKVTAKLGVVFTNVYETASLTAKKFTFADSEEIGLVTNVSVKNGADTFIEVTAANKTKFYILSTQIYNYCEVDETGLPANPTTANTGQSTLDKILGVFTGLAALFGKTKSTTTEPKTGTGTDSGDSSNPDTKTPETPKKKTFGEWIKANVILVVGGSVIVIGGITWAIVASVKASKEKANQMNNPQNNVNS